VLDEQVCIQVLDEQVGVQVFVEQVGVQVFVEQVDDEDFVEHFGTHAEHSQVDSDLVMIDEALQCLGILLKKIKLI